MKAEKILKKKCRLCNSSKGKTVLDFKDTPVGDDYTSKPSKKKLYPLKINMCMDCGFLQLSKSINPKILYGDYLYVTKTSLGLPKHFKNLALKLKREKILFKGCKVLEIGSNDGTLLNFLKQLGAKVLGVDPAANKRDNHNIETINKLFDYKLSNKIKKKYGEFDLIIANNVIANVDDLNNIFDGVKKILKPGGYFVMETFSLAGLVKNSLIDNIYHEHLSYFTIKPLIKFLEKKKLFPYFIDHIKTKGGSLRLIFKKDHSALKHKKKIQKSITLENQLKLHKAKTYEKIQIDKKKNNYEVYEYLKKNFFKGKKIYGFGASVGTTTSVYDLNIKKFIIGIYDHEKIRHNLFLPSSKIQVRNPNKIMIDKPDILIIFAWRYKDNILKKINLPKSTVVIQHLPNLKIIKKK